MHMSSPGHVASQVKANLLLAGLVPNKEKSQWCPTQNLDWLGLSWDSGEGSIKVTQRRIQSILECIVKLQVSLPLVSARELASFNR